MAGLWNHNREPLHSVAKKILAMAVTISILQCCCQGFSISACKLASSRLLVTMPPYLQPHSRGKPPHYFQQRAIASRLFLAEEQETPSGGDEESPSASTVIDLNLDDRLYRLRLSRATGIEWGTDLSFAFVYVRQMDPTGAAALTGKIEVGDQLCELQAVTEDGEETPVVNLIGAPFDYVMNAFASLDMKVKELDLVFFRGTKDELKAVCNGGNSSDEPDIVTITVIENKGSEKEIVKTLQAPAGCNVRQVLTDNNINVYQSITRWTNCKGKQLCGTCIVNIKEGSMQTNRKSMDEASTLRENPDSYRLSCVTFAYGDITVETFPPIEAAQWTR